MAIINAKVDDTELSYFRVGIPRQLREKVRAVARALRCSTTALVTAGLMDRVEAYEAKVRAQEDRRRKQREEREKKIAPVRVDKKSFAPADVDLSPSAKRDAAPEPAIDDSAKVNELYLQYAEQIVAVGVDNVVERRLIAAEAVLAIRNLRPLTSPPEHAILNRLEKLVVKLQPAPPPPPDTPPAPTPTAEELRGSMLERLFENIMPRNSTP